MAGPLRRAQAERRAQSRIRGAFDKDVSSEPLAFAVDAAPMGFQLQPIANTRELAEVVTPGPQANNLPGNTELP
jgi:hypothetical protein